MVEYVIIVPFPVSVTAVLLVVSLLVCVIDVLPVVPLVECGVLRDMLVVVCGINVLVLIV